MIVGCYTMDLYCDGSGPHLYKPCPEQYVGDSKQDVYKEAKHRGWHLDLKNNLAYRPKCAKEIKKNENHT